ncbi:MAG: HAD family hydrolase [Methanocellales archaeon]|nr:HAD family hydrolase [Methanocellales archaeon]
MGVKTIFFDAYGTLLELGDYYYDLAAQVLDEVGCSINPHLFWETWNDAFNGIIFDINEGQHPFTNIRTTYKISLKNAFLMFGISISDGRLDELNRMCKALLDQRCTILPSTRETIEALKHKEDVKIGLISNGDNDELSHHLGELVELFDATTISENVRAYKPDTRIFQAALKELNANPEEALFIGDNLRIDVNGANKAGIRSVWYNQKGALPEDGIKPHFTIANINEVLEIVKLLIPLEDFLF